MENLIFSSLEDLLDLGLTKAEIDNLIAQKYLDRFHNKDQFYKIDNLPKERIEEVINLINKRIKIIDSREE